MTDPGGGTIAKRHAVAGAEGSCADWFGVVCSAGCAIHCATMPVLLAILPSFSSIRLLVNPAFHQLVAIVCTVLVIRAILPQWKRHRDWRVGGAALTGLALLLFAAFVLPDRCCDTMLSGTNPPVVTGSGPLTTDQVSSASVKQQAADDHSRGGLNRAPSKLPASSDRSGYLLVSTDAHSLLVVSEGSEARDRGPCDNPFSVRDRPSGLSETTYGDAHSRQTLASIAGRWSRPVVSLTTLSNWLGADSAHAVVSLQPFLSPLGGVFLVIAHLLNLSLRRSEEDCCPGI